MHDESQNYDRLVALRQEIDRMEDWLMHLSTIVRDPSALRFTTFFVHVSRAIEELSHIVNEMGDREALLARSMNPPEKGH